MSLELVMLQHCLYHYIYNASKPTAPRLCLGGNGRDRTAQNTVIWFTSLWYLSSPCNISASLSAPLQVNILESCTGHLMVMCANLMQHKKALLFQIFSVEIISKRIFIHLGFMFPYFIPVYSSSLIQDLCVVQALSIVNGERYKLHKGATNSASLRKIHYLV